jgi:O-antigen ligase
VSTPPTPSAERGLDGLRLFALHGLALCLFLAPAGVAAGLLLIWLWFLLRLMRGPRLPSHPVVWLALLFALYALLQLGFPRVEPVAEGTAAWVVALSWAQLIVFVPVAYALGGREPLVLRLLLLALIGLVLGTLWRLDWALLVSDAAAFFDARPGFGFPALGYALFSGTALIGLLTLRRRCWLRADGRLRPWALPLWGGALVLLAEGFILTQARGSWLGLGLVGLLGLSLWLRQQLRVRGRIPRAPLITAALALSVLIALNASEILDRLSDEQEVAQQLLRGEQPVEQITSITLRWSAQRFGLEHWLQRPWLGWGPGASYPLMLEAVADSAGSDAAAGLWDPTDGVLKHLHNSYLEILTQLGLVGLALWMAMAVLLMLGIVGGLRQGSLSRDLGLFLLLALLYLALWSLFNFRMVHQDFRGYWALLAGVALSLALYRPAAAEGR